jgi:pre-rRNA-processing protein RIX1
VTKELCIIALTKIYCMTHHYQTLVREITTPTLPAFITSCLNLISKSSSKAIDEPSSLRETIFGSFSLLLPRHTTIYRPFISQIRLATQQFLAPTSSDSLFVSQSFKESARRLAVLLHQTAPKNAGGQEWAKAVRDLVQGVHETADLIFRAVVEDWESSAGYTGRPVDVNQSLHGGGKTVEDFPPWTGIHAGVERITGMLEMLAEYFKGETSATVAIPLGPIVDMATRMLSIALPPSSEFSASYGAARLHPAIDRDEKDGLWSGMPQIYVGALQLTNMVAERMEEAFLSISHGSLEQLVWVFPFGKHSSEFRLASYNLTAKTLFLIGQSFDRPQVAKLSGIIRSCCHDLQPVDPNSNNFGCPESSEKKTKVQLASSHHNADTFLRSSVGVPLESRLEKTDLAVTAGELLPLLLSHIPQQYLDVSLRSLVERTAILTHNKSAMLASILNPFVGKNGRAMTSILPHLTREFGTDDIVEILLRPRMPLLPSTSTRMHMEAGIEEAPEDDEMEINPGHWSIEEDVPPTSAPFLQQDSIAVATSAVAHPGFGPSIDTLDVKVSHSKISAFGSHDSSLTVPTSGTKFIVNTVNHSLLPEQDRSDVNMDQDNDSSGDESVHLMMQLDTDSDSDG